ncbi:ArsR family transcriptional regulator [Thermoproteus sp. CP80]|nr:MAG: ArsR family transcriptional regulator [Thermoproteus sp. CIS_19]PLC65694.1 ArsR family transcriptional regulator [Thermoproteus sp. CP80]
MWADRRSLKRVLLLILLGTRGGPARLKILARLRARPMNAHQLSKELDIDYKTARHHLEVLEKNGLVERLGEGYGAVYTLSDMLQKNWDLVAEAARYLGYDSLDN